LNVHAEPNVANMNFFQHLLYLDIAEFHTVIITMDYGFREPKNLKFI
jgi:hypothetical protein